MLITKKVKILTKYSDFLDVFLKKKTLILSEITKLNQHAIKLQEGQQPPYKLIYSLGLVEFEMLKTYIETNPTNSFIWPLKSLVDTSIFFVRKLDSNFYPCMDY